MVVGINATILQWAKKIEEEEEINLCWWYLTFMMTYIRTTFYSM